MTLRQSLAFFACLLVATLSGIEAQGQSANEDEPLADEIRSIQLKAIDGRGHAISALRRDDFSVWENGGQRAIVSFHDNRNSRLLTILILDQLHTGVGAITRASLALEKILVRQDTRDVCIYLINPKGELVPVSGVTNWSAASKGTTGVSERLRSELGRSFPVQADLAHNPGSRFDKAVSSLQTLLQELEGISNPRNIIWMASGFGILNGKEEFPKLAADVNQVGAPLYILQDASLSEDSSGSAMVSTQEELEQLANLTGGGVMTNLGVEQAIAKARTDLLDSYTVEYVEREEERRDDYHSLRIVSKRADMRLQYQRVYFAARP